jgi:hypothetical protein
MSLKRSCATSRYSAPTINTTLRTAPAALAPKPKRNSRVHHLPRYPDLYRERRAVRIVAIKRKRPQN